MTQAVNPSERWTTLVNAAVLGTDRASPPIESGGCPWLVGGKPDDTATAFLNEAASLAVYELAGRSTPPVEVPELEVFESDERVCSPQAGRHLHIILYGGRESVLAEWCEAALATGLVAPPELVPRLLSKASATRDNALWQTLRSVAGERGAWLMNLNHEWRPPVDAGASLADLTELWESGDRDERLAVLRRVRAVEPQRAAELLAAAWDSEPAADRVRLLGLLADGLSAGDEPWLEACLDDRSKQVRSKAAELLSALPTSALSARMALRVSDVVEFKPGAGVVRKKKATVELTVPEKLDDAWKRDSLEAKAVGGLGAKAAMLRRLATLAPLSAWFGTSHSASSWIAAAAASDWTDALLQGWAEAAGRQRDAAWAEALLTSVCLERPGESVGMQDEWRLKQVQPLLASLPREVAERLTRDAIADRGRHTPVQYAEAALKACDFPWGGELSDAVVGAMSKRLAGKDVVYDQPLRSLLGVAACRLAPAVADRAAREWTANQEHWSTNFSEAVHDAVDTLRLRRDMLAAMQDSSPNMK